MIRNGFSISEDNILYRGRIKNNIIIYGENNYYNDSGLILIDKNEQTITTCNNYNNNKPSAMYENTNIYKYSELMGTEIKILCKRGLADTTNFLYHKNYYRNIKELKDWIKKNNKFISKENNINFYSDIETKELENISISLLFKIENSEKKLDTKINIFNSVTDIHGDNEYDAIKKCEKYDNIFKNILMNSDDIYRMKQLDSYFNFMNMDFSLGQKLSKLHELLMEDIIDLKIFKIKKKELFNH